MRLKNILQNVKVKEIKNFKNYNISSITHISTDVVSHSIFLCIKGNDFNGNDYIADAIYLGAKCIVTECEDVVVDNACVVVVDDVRIAMSIMAKNFYNRCVDDMKIIGVVGTSGKTTISTIIQQLIKNTGKKVGLIGTNGIYIDNIRQENKFTTPDPLELHYVFYQMKMLGVKIVVMEVSAQSIFYNKLHGIIFDIVVFTNISREHLDFFGSMENYVKTKMNFFSSKNMKECVVNIDDFYGRELAYKVLIPCVSYGIKEPANCFAIDIEYEMTKTKFVANILDDVFDVSVPYIGEYNVYNMLAGLTVAKMLGVSSEDLKKSVSKLKEIDGRFNVFTYGKKTVVIDFAHTPDSIDKLLSHIKKFASGNIISVFGCVGYSDKDKREEMGMVVSRYSDMIIVTTDNRGTTQFSDIANDIIVGIGDGKFVCIEDRLSAISYASKIMQDKDVLVLIGKGAENFQKIENKRVTYSDRDSVISVFEKG